MNSGPARVEACQSETESNVYNVLERDKAIVLLPENVDINKIIVLFHLKLCFITYCKIILADY